MLRLVRKREIGDAPLPRMWLVFFGEAHGAAWWARMMRPGFRHVSAACWHVEGGRWVYFNPTRRGLVIELYEEGEFPLRALVEGSAATLRVNSRFERGAMPAAFHCVAAIKALLGVRSCALSPHRLFRDLLAKGAETVAAPREDDLGLAVQNSDTVAAAAGGPRRQGDA